jgi:serine/threonine-protein kinase
VFKAEDLALERYVAVKLLHPELAEDPTFLHRFRAEARSVASLNHPFVLRVFDWGEDAEGPYLVLEYLVGGSLRHLLDRGYRLTHAQAATVGAQAAEGLAYAHSRGLVHRDIKPANLLFDEEGRVRVADFGVARALADTTWTERGAMIGTVRYAAPEQAQGQPLDGRADVYALALVLYEAVSGVVPFVADTTLATLMARVGAALPNHEALGPLDNVLVRACAPERDARLSAAGLAARLDALASALPTPAPLPLDIPAAALARPPRRTSTPSYPDASGEETLQVVRGLPTARTAPGTGTWSDTVVPASGHQVFDVELLERPAPTSGPPAAASSPKRRRWGRWAVAALVVAALAAAGIYIADRAKLFTPSHPVPNLLGATLASAHRSVARLHFHVSAQRPRYSITVPEGAVISQQPRAGVSLKEGSTIEVVPSKGLPPETIPSLSGLDCTGAQRVLTVANLVGTCPTSAAAYSTTVPQGQVISWSYNGATNPTVAPYHSTIVIAISQGLPPVTIPSVAGQSYAQAQAALQAAGLQSTESQQTSTTVPAGQVTGTNPAAGATVPHGSTVTVYVSTGPPLVAVPSLDKDTVAQATAALNAVGLKLGSVYGPSGGKVFASNPSSGTTVQIGSSVSIYVQ